MKQTHLFLVSIDSCQIELVGINLSQSLSSILTDPPPRKGLGGGLGEDGKGGKGGRKPPSCHNTEPRILLCFDANVSDAPRFVLKFGGGVGRRVRGPLSLQAMA